jgi:hypothetical protein
MENRAAAIVASDREAELRLVQVAAVVRLARSATEEFRRMRQPRVNLLLVGRPDFVQLVLRSVLGRARKAIVRWSPGEALVLPTDGRPRTLVLRDVGSLGVREQMEMLEWSAGVSRNTQTISTASAPLWPRVAAGDFDETLYYRLNRVYLDDTRLADVA